jgi:hypothetical protein
MTDMSDLAAEVTRLTGLPAAIGADLAIAGGILRCGACGTEQPLGDVGAHIGHGWPACCGLTMTWVTARQLSWESRQPVPEGCELVAVPEDDARWQVDTIRRCRAQGSGNRSCGLQSVMSLLRGYSKPSRYGYCADHAYGRWVEDGKVMCWILREVA